MNYNKIKKSPKTTRVFVDVNNARDLYDVIVSHDGRPMFSYFDFGGELKDLSYAEFADIIKACTNGLFEKGLNGKKIAVIGDSCPEWLCVYLSVLLTGGIIIPMDKELRDDEINNFLKWVGADAIFFTSHQSENMMKISQENNGIRFYSLHPIDNVITDLRYFSDLVECGKNVSDDKYIWPDLTRKANDVAEYLFTSGTTGSSKCVMLSQKNIFSCVTSACASVDFYPTDKVVSVLPLHHTYELAISLAEMTYGIHICINDSLSHVIKNFKLFQPNALILVPLFVYTMQKKIWSEAKKRKMENKLKLGIIASGTLSTVGIDIRRKVFSEILDSFGGKLEKIICGGAALDPFMIETFENFGIHIYEGYGITECSPLVAVTPYYARKYGSVGLPVPCCSVRIDPESETMSENGFRSGEIEVKGDNVMIGYYDNDKANAESFTEDGWYRTGDLGYIDDDGYIFITGRKKSVIVLENGKNVFPEEIEEYLSKIEIIKECVVVGRQENEHSQVVLTAIVFPDYDKFEKDADLETVQKALDREITQLNKKLPSFKRILHVEIRNTEFDKTTSRKIKRHTVS